METEPNITVSASEIERTIEKKEEQKMEEEGPNFAPLSAQELAVFLQYDSVIFRDQNKFDVFAVLQIVLYPFDLIW